MTIINGVLDEGNIVDLDSLEGIDVTNILVQALEDYNWEKSNRLYKRGDNQSFPRDIQCSECQRRVVMSVALFRLYEESPMPDKVICSKCFIKA